MADKNIYDDEKVTVKARIDGDPLTLAKVKDAKFLFTLDKAGTTEEIAPQTGNAEGFPKVATLTWTPPKVADTLDYYDVRYKVEVAAPGKTPIKIDGSETIRVWPKTVKATFTADKPEDKKKVAFNVTTKEKVSNTAKKQANDAGVWEGTLPYGEWVVDALAPWEKTDVKATGRVREYKVVKKPAKARFVSPDPDNPADKIKQFVNLPIKDPWEKANPAGSLVTFKVATVDDKGAPGDLIHIECQFGLESKRNVPKPALTRDLLEAGTGQESNSGKTWKGQVKLLPDKTATFKVQLGLAGGDTCTVKIGTTSACADAELKFENWRKVIYELTQPETSGANKVTDFTLTAGAGLAAATLSHMQIVLGKSFVELKEDRKRKYIKTDLVASGAHNILDKGHFKEAVTGKVTVLCWNDVSALLDSKSELSADKRAFSMLFMDYVTVSKEWDEGYEFYFEPEFSPGMWLMPIALEDGFSLTRGDYPIRRVSWKATHYLKDAGDPAQTADWLAITADTDPGGTYRNATELTTEVAIKKMVRIKNATRMVLTFPNEANYPGAMKDGTGMLVNGGKKIKIRVEFKGVRYVPLNGAALFGKIGMCTMGGDAHDVGLANVLLHEMGHNMGMTYLAKAKITPDNMKTWGRDPAHDIPGIAAPDAVPTGKYYAGHGHQGCHCAEGVSDANKAEADYQAKALTGTCLMFGSSDMAGSTKIYFCDDCKTYLSADKLDSVKRNWTAP